MKKAMRSVPGVRHGHLLAAAVVGLAAMWPVPVWATRPETYVRIDVPGAAATIASGINADGAIVGWYCLQLPCNAARQRGYMLTASGFTYIDVPPAADRQVIGTRARGISPQGIVIGDYVVVEGGVNRLRGYAWFAGQFEFFDPPDELFDNPVSDTVRHHVIPMRMSANGEIVGCFHDRNTMDSMHGFVLSDGQWTRYGPGMTMHNGVTPAGDIAGLDFGTDTGYHLDRNGNRQEVVFPGAEATDAWDINPRGEIVGTWYEGAASVPHAYLRSAAGSFRTIEPPGATRSQAGGIAPNGDVVGIFVDATGTHAFLLMRGE